MIQEKHQTPDITQLRCFVAVAEELHFGRAAQRLHMTQPPLSRQVRLLEDRLGLVLFERSTRSVRLTPGGAALLPRARQAVSALDAVAAHARLLAAGHGGTVRIGFATGASYGFLPRLVTTVAAVLPAVELSLLEIASADQVAALEAGQLDLAIVRPLQSRGTLHIACVARDPLRLAVPRGHRLARLGRAVAAGDLADEPFLLYSANENPYFHGLIATIMHRAQFTPARVQHVRAIHTMLSLVAAGVGLAIVPDVSRQFTVPGVVLRPLADAFAATADLHMAWRPERLSPAAQRIVAEVLPKMAAAVPGKEA